MYENIRNRLVNIKLPQLNIKKYEIPASEEKTTVIPPYDVKTHGDVVSFSGIPGHVEVERYWVNEPFSFISIQFDEENNDYIYYVVEPELTPFEATLLSDVYEASRDILSYKDLIKGANRKDILMGKVKEIIDKRIQNFDIKSFHKLAYYITRN